MKYLDPKNDLTFKKVFGQHPDLLRSFLNAVLPLADDAKIEKLEYLSGELVPQIPVLKHTIVDVRCIDQKGRQFIVEMQMFWTESFKHRMVFNASKAYVKQLERKQNYSSLQPVYALSLVNQEFDKDTDAFYHHYQIVNIEDTDKQLEGLEFVFVDLVKFKAQNIRDMRMIVLWLRFLTEVEEDLKVVPEELLQIPEIRQALETVSESAFTKEELEGYDKYWDTIRSERTLFEDAEKRGEAKSQKKLAEAQRELQEAQRQKEEAKEREVEAQRQKEEAQRQKEEAMQEKRSMQIATAKKLKAIGMPIDEIAALSGLSIEEAESL